MIPMPPEDFCIRVRTPFSLWDTEFSFFASRDTEIIRRVSLFRVGRQILTGTQDSHFLRPVTIGARPKTEKDSIRYPFQLSASPELDWSYYPYADKGAPFGAPRLVD